MKRIFYFLLLFIAACSNPSNPNPNELSVNISSPGGIIYTNGNINIQVVVSGGSPDTVELLKNDEVLVNNLTAPYSYAWDTTSEAEGVYKLIARVSSGGKTVDSAVRSVTIDRTKPSLVSHTPEANAENVWMKDRITLTFSEPIHPASVNGSSISLVKNPNQVVVAVQLELSGDGKTLAVKPSSFPTLPAELELYVSSDPFDKVGLTDLAGNYISFANVRWKVPLWQQPGGKLLDVEVANVVSQPKVAVDKEGNTTVAWLEAQDRFSLNALYVRQWNGSAWTQLGEDLRVDKDDSVGFLSLALDSTGHPVLAWDEREGHIHVKRWDGANWVYVGAPIGKGAESPSLALDSKDNPVLAWVEWTSTNDAANILVTRWDGSDWQRVGTALNTGIGKVPSLRLDASDRPVVAWEEWDAVNNIYVKRFDGSQWVSVGDFLDTAPEPWAKTPSLALDAAGNPMVAWTEADANFNPTKSFLYVKQWNGSQWEFVKFAGPLNSDKTNRALDPSLQLSKEGTPFLTWQETSSSESVIVLKYVHENFWETLEPPSKAAHSYTLALVLDVDGNPVMAWPEASGTDVLATDLYVKRKNPGEIRTPRVLLGSISLTYLLHCLPEDFASKGVVF